MHSNRSYTGTNNNIIHTVHALSATYGKDRLTGGGRLSGGRFIQGVIDRGEGAIDRSSINNNHCHAHQTLLSTASCKLKVGAQGIAQ